MVPTRNPMCLTIPACVVSIDNETALIENYNHARTRVKISHLENINVGDWLLHTVGSVLKRIDPDEAEQIIALLANQVQLDLSQASEYFTAIIKKAQQETPSLAEIVYLLKTTGEEQKILLSEANVVRQTYLQDFFCIHGIIEFSNYCHNQCLYCGIRADNANLTRYRLTKKEIIDLAIEAIQKKGYKLLVLQSGEDLTFSADDLVEIVTEIKKLEKVFVFLSIGERDFETYSRLKQAGANGVLFRFETSNPELYSYLHPGQSFENRMRHLKWFQELGYYIATGSLIGVPGQILEDLAQDILFFTREKLPMASFGPFLPCPDTPLQHSFAGEFNLALKTIAVLRLLNKTVKIPVVTALETLDKVAGRQKALTSGANALMFNLTSPSYRALYQIYPDKYFGEEKLWEKYGLFNQPDSYEMLEEKLRI